MIVEPELPDHPDYLLLKKAVGDFAMEALIRLWGHCQSNRRGERWLGKTADYVEAVTRWDGERGNLFRALKDYGWIEVFEGGVNIHNWDKMNAKLLASRSNGGKGGRPGKSLNDNGAKPNDNPSKTQDEPENNKQEVRLSPSKNGGSTEVNGKPNDNLSLTREEPEPNPTQTRPSGLSGLSGLSGSSGGLGDFYPMAKQRVVLLNVLTGAEFNPPLPELDQIVSRLQEVGGDVVGVDAMIRRQVALWKEDPKSRQWLKPGTLFGANFHDYYGQRFLAAVKPAPAGFGKNRAALTDRTEMLETLSAIRAQLEKQPDDAGLKERARELELQTA